MAGIYKIGSKLGYDLANGMKAGDTVTATDGSVWTKNADGSIGVVHNGQNLVGQITYQPTNQEAAAQMPGASGYQSPYSTQIQAALNEVYGSKWEGWDKDSDPSYQAYRKEYLREADRSMEDTLGQYAQNTGGIAGSQAIAAASQAADYYKSQLADKVPELYENAYGRYLNDLQQKQNTINLMMNAENQAQSGYYQQISYALSKWAQMGYADQEVAALLGVTAGTPTSDQSYTDWSTAFQREQFDYEKQQAQASTAVSGSGYSGSSSGSSGGSGAQDYEGLFAAAKASGNPKSYIANNYKKYGFTSATGLYDDYRAGQEQAESGTGMPTAEFNEFWRGLKEYVSAGLLDRLDKLLADNIDRLSEEQYQKVMEQLQKLGG